MILIHFSWYYLLPEQHNSLQHLFATEPEIYLAAEMKNFRPNEQFLSERVFFFETITIYFIFYIFSSIKQTHTHDFIEKQQHIRQDHDITRFPKQNRNLKRGNYFFI